MLCFTGNHLARQTKPRNITLLQDAFGSVTHDLIPIVFKHSNVPDDVIVTTHHQLNLTQVEVRHTYQT